MYFQDRINWYTVELICSSVDTKTYFSCYGSKILSQYYVGLGTRVNDGWYPLLIEYLGIESSM
jgi:hypothetical protein